MFAERERCWWRRRSSRSQYIISFGEKENARLDSSEDKRAVFGSRRRFRVPFRTVYMLLRYVFRIVRSVSLSAHSHIAFESFANDVKGHRPYMEDRYAVAVTKGSTNISLYGVFDGHGGSRASDFCVEFLLKNVSEDPTYPNKPEAALVNGFLKTDAQFLEIAKSGYFDDGTTAVVAMIEEEHIYVGNVGDSRAVLIRKNEKEPVELSRDHKPNRPDERNRIEGAGGIVVHVGVWRVEGVLAVSRAIGDRPFKEYVIGKPEVIRHKRCYENDEYLVLASDGLWDVMKNDVVAEIVRSAATPEDAAWTLTETAFTRGSRDNICALVVDLGACQREAPEAAMETENQ